jgi:hypothetical protein
MYTFTTDVNAGPYNKVYYLILILYFLLFDFEISYTI